MNRGSVLPGQVTQERFQIVAELLSIGNEIALSRLGHDHEGPSSYA